MRHLIKPTRRLLRRVLIVLLVGIALINVAAFLLTPLLDRYHDKLAELASDHFGVPISVARLEARWRGFGPEMVMHDLHIGAEDSPDRIELNEAAVDFGIWDMIRHLDLSPLRVTLRDLTIHLVRHPDGRVELVGFGGDSLAASHTGGLPISGRLRLEAVTVLWDDRLAGLPVQRFEQAHLRLHLWPDRVSLSARTRLPGEHAGRLLLGADIRLHDDDWSGEIYLAGEMNRPDALLAAYVPAPLSVQQGRARFEIWSDWHQGRLTGTEGDLFLGDLQLSRSDGPDLNIGRLSTTFRYRRNGTDRQLDLADLRLERDGHAWPATDVHLSVDTATPARPVVQLSADYLQLGDLAALSRPLPLPADWVELRDALQPDGELRDLRLALNTTGSADDPRVWQLSTDFDSLSAKPWNDYPGIDGLSGTARGGHDDLQLQVRATGSMLDWPTLFRAPIRVTRLIGELNWQRLDDNSHALTSQALVVDTPDIRSVNRLRLHLPLEGSPDIDLHSELRDGDGRHAARYLPTRHMDPDLVKWLDHAISSGHVPAGTLILRGPLSDFPFHESRNGRFEARFDVRDLTLNYQASWPALHIDDAAVTFHNNSVAIQLRQGHIFSTQLSATEARIDSLDPISPVKITGQTSGPLADLLRFVANSPLQARLGDLASQLRTTGKATLALDMGIALEAKQRDTLAGRLQLTGNTLSVPAAGLELQNARGTLTFDLDSVHGDGLRAEIAGQPLKLRVSPHGNGHRVEADTTLTAQALLKQAPQLGLARPTGQTPVTVTLDIPNDRNAGSTMLGVASPLTGLALALPEPLGKRADARRPLQVEVPVAKGTVTGHLRYGDDLDAAFLSDGSRVGIRLGGDRAQLPDSTGVTLTGQLPLLQLDPWLALFEQESTGGAGSMALQTDLTLGKLQVGRTQLDDIRVQLARTTDGWAGKAEGPRFAGQFLVPGDQAQPIILNLDRFSLDLDRDDRSPGTPEVDPGSPADWPALDLNVKSLLINGQDFGSLTLKARHQDDSLKLDPIRISGGLADFDGLAVWRGSGARADTDLSGKLTTPGLGRVLEALGYSKSFRKAPATADLAIGWPGNPGDASLATLRGHIKLDIGQGQLLELEPGVARAFGLLNFSAIQRRLRLDFSDLFGKGLAFDSIRGNFRLIDGNAYTTDLTLTGPSSDIAITGRTGLVNQDFYQDVTVTPRFDATLPIAGTLAGGPIAGVAVLVAQTVMKDKVDKFNRLTYRVTGSWDDPVVEQTGGGTLSKVLSPVTDLFKGDGTTPQASEPGPFEEP